MQLPRQVCAGVSLLLPSKQTGKCQIKFSCARTPALAEECTDSGRCRSLVNCSMQLLMPQWICINLMDTTMCSWCSAPLKVVQQQKLSLHVASGKLSQVRTTFDLSLSL